MSVRALPGIHGWGEWNARDYEQFEREKGWRGRFERDGIGKIEHNYNTSRILLEQFLQT